MLKITNPAYGYVESTYTLDELIAQLEKIRKRRGGNIPIAVMKDSSNTAHLLDGGRDLATYYKNPQDVWEKDYEYRGPVVVLHIND